MYCVRIKLLVFCLIQHVTTYRLQYVFSFYTVSFYQIKGKKKKTLSQKFCTNLMFCFPTWNFGKLKLMREIDVWKEFPLLDNVEIGSYNLPICLSNRHDKVGDITQIRNLASIYYILRAKRTFFLLTCILQYMKQNWSLFVRPPRPRRYFAERVSLWKATSWRNVISNYIEVKFIVAIVIWVAKSNLE